jgi:hypothetical protein
MMNVTTLPEIERIAALVERGISPEESEAK